LMHSSAATSVGLREEGKRVGVRGSGLSIETNPLTRPR
jgi:hypothetical protein